MTTVKNEQFVTDNKGGKEAVILDAKLYQEMLEDLEDLRLLAERKDVATSSLKEVEARLRADGLMG
jgi:PHD/YefM family antitoxin component YafN of YafNO toxin-antitoxin module